MSFLSGSFYQGPQQKAADPLQRSARATLCPQTTTLGPLLFALGCSALLSHPSWEHGALRESHLGRRNQGSMTLRTTRATTTEDSVCPYLTLPWDNASITALLSPSKAPHSPFLRLSKATLCPGSPFLNCSSPGIWEGQAELPSLFCKPQQGPGHPTLILGSYLG